MHYFIDIFFLIDFTEPHPPTNLSAVVHCKQGYEIQIDWQVQLIQLHTNYCILWMIQQQTLLSLLQSRAVN